MFWKGKQILAKLGKKYNNILALLLLKSDHSLFNHRSERLCALRSR